MRPWLVGTSFIAFVCVSSFAEHRSMVSRVNELERRLGTTEGRLDPLPSKIQNLEATQKAAGLQPDLIVKVSADPTASIFTKTAQKPIIRSMKNVAVAAKGGTIDTLLH